MPGLAARKARDIPVRREAEAVGVNNALDILWTNYIRETRVAYHSLRLIVLRTSSVLGLITIIVLLVWSPVYISYTVGVVDRCAYTGQGGSLPVPVKVE